MHCPCANVLCACAIERGGLQLYNWFLEIPCSTVRGKGPHSNRLLTRQQVSTQVQTHTNKIWHASIVLERRLLLDTQYATSCTWSRLMDGVHARRSDPYRTVDLRVIAFATLHSKGSRKR